MMQMPSKTDLILGFDTSGPWIGAVVLSGGAVLSDHYDEMKKGQAEQLFPILEEVLSQAGLGWPDLDALGVGIGPGNFTGIRIAVSAARGLSMSLGIPAVGVNLLEAAALDAAGPVLSTIAAPRDQAYIEGFGTVHNTGRHMLAIGDIPQSFASGAPQVVGSAGAAVAAHLGLEHVPAAYAPASAIARIAASRYADAPPPSPLYFRPADAAPASDPPPRILDDA